MNLLKVEEGLKMLMKIIEAFDDKLCAICESNPILDHITRLGMDDKGYWLTMVKEAQSKQASGETKVAARWGKPVKE